MFLVIVFFCLIEIVFYICVISGWCVFCDCYNCDFVVKLGKVIFYSFVID